MTYRNMTYREAIQLQIKALQEIYDNAGHLRDAADGVEEKAFNSVRRNLPAVWGFLQELDDAITDDRASMQVKGNYSIIVNSL